MKLKWYKDSRDFDDFYAEWYFSEEGRAVRDSRNSCNQELFEDGIKRCFKAGYEASRGQRKVVYTKYTEEDRKRMMDYIKENRGARSSAEKG